MSASARAGRSRRRVAGGSPPATWSWRIDLHADYGKLNRIAPRLIAEPYDDILAVADSPPPVEAFNEPYPLSTGRVSARPAGEGTDGASTPGNRLAAKTERK